MIPEATRKRIEAELTRAEQARAEGKEGMARVCARRAAGWAAAGEKSGSAVDRLRSLAADDSAPAEVRQAAARLTARLSPDHTLPFEQDPLDDARLIVRYADSNA
jgi:hypothetical protein